MTTIYNTSDTKQLRRSLRKDIPMCERILWSKLRNRQVNDLKFRRQYSIGRYVVDFYCAEIKLAIELDGSSHDTDTSADYDLERQSWIESIGIRVIRFTNRDAVLNMNDILEQIAIIDRPEARCRI
jgi:very-short-patch-repair endonuclease